MPYGPRGCYFAFSGQYMFLFFKPCGRDMLAYKTTIENVISKINNELIKTPQAINTCFM